MHTLHAFSRNGLSLCTKPRFCTKPLSTNHRGTKVTVTAEHHPSQAAEASQPRAPSGQAPAQSQEFEHAKCPITRPIPSSTPTVKGCKGSGSPPSALLRAPRASAAHSAVHPSSKGVPTGPLPPTFCTSPCLSGHCRPQTTRFPCLYTAPLGLSSSGHLFFPHVQLTI